MAIKAIPYLGLTSCAKHRFGTSTGKAQRAQKFNLGQILSPPPSHPVAKLRLGYLS